MSRNRILSEGRGRAVGDARLRLIAPLVLVAFSFGGGCSTSAPTARATPKHNPAPDSEAMDGLLFVTDEDAQAAARKAVCDYFRERRPGFSPNGVGLIQISGNLLAARVDCNIKDGNTIRRNIVTAVVQRFYREDGTCYWRASPPDPFLDSIAQWRSAVRQKHSDTTDANTEDDPAD